VAKTQSKDSAHTEDYLYEGAALKKSWDRLHGGDREPFPADKDLQQAWQLFHAGQFQAASKLGRHIGGAGHNPAVKAMVMQATYLEPDAGNTRLLEEAMRLADRARAGRRDDANASYFYALAAGRYSQRISVGKALSQGLGGQVRDALTQALELEPRHADAHIAFGAWHAEILGKVGATIGGLTYGASREAGEEHFEKALQLNPHSASRASSMPTGSCSCSARRGWRRPKPCTRTPPPKRRRMRWSASTSSSRAQSWKTPDPR
jgi:hypothetical protein